MTETRSPVSRRNMLRFTGASTAAALATTACSPTQAPPPARVTTIGRELPDAENAWRQLLDGNARFVEGRATHPHQTADWRMSLVQDQHPFACVIACADSRVGPEVVFDEGLGDLFVVRSAGEVLDDAVVGSVEYAVEHLHVPLVAVVGHAGCGAVKAAIEVVEGKGHVSDSISALVRGVEAAVRAVPPQPDAQRFLDACVAEQARRSATQLVERSSLLREATEQGRLAVRAAEYELITGRVREVSL